MNRDRILQVRLDRDLARDLRDQVERARRDDARVTESVVARMLLRDALAARGGRPLPVGEQAFKEGWLRGYGEAKRAMQEAMKGSEPFRRSGTARGEAP